MCSLRRGHRALDAAAGSKMHWQQDWHHHRALQCDKGPAQHPHAPDICSAPVAPSTTCFCPPVWCHWRTGAQAQPCYPWDNTCAGKCPHTVRKKNPGRGTASLWSLLFMTLSRSSHGP